MVSRSSGFQGIVKEEVDYVKKLGVTVLLDSVIGKLDTVDELLTDSMQCSWHRRRTSCFYEYRWRKPKWRIFGK